MARTTRFLLPALAILLLILVRPAVPRAEAIASPPAPARVALVVGNGDYRAGPLRTAANDAGLVAQALAQAGFDVTAAANVDAKALQALVDGFLTKARAAGPEAVLVVYLSGYGLQCAGENYIVPIDAVIARDADVSAQAVPLAALMRQLAAVPAAARVLVGDLARPNPFAKVGPPLAPGLALVVPPTGVAVAFNAAPGAEAPADPVPYGAYARALAEMIQTPGVPLGALFVRVRLRAGELTDGVAVPWTSGTFGDATPSPGAGNALGVGSDVTAASAYSALIASDTLADALSFLKLFPIDALAPRVRVMAAVRREAMIWSDSVSADSARAFWTYMRRYPRGPHFADARRRLVRLHAQLEPPPRFDIVSYDDVAPPPAGEADLLGPAAVVKGPPIPRAPPSLLPAQRAAFSDDMAPPPLVAAGMLPIPMPISLPDGVRAIGAAGTITQPGVPTLGPVVVAGTVSASGSTLTASGTNGLLSKSVEGVGTPRSIVETDAGGAIISRTEVAADRTGGTVVQTGPGGDLVLKLVTQAKAGGGRSTIATDGRNETVSTVTRDDQGIVTSVRPGAASARALNPVFLPAKPGQRPVLVRSTLPPAEPVPETVDRAALAAPMPPPPLALPPLPAAPAPVRADVPKPTTTVEKAAPSNPATGPAPPVAKSEAASPSTDSPTTPEPSKSVSAVPSSVPPSVPPAGAGVPEPPRRPEAIAPTRGGKTAAKAAARPRAAPARARVGRSRPGARRRR